MDKIIMNYYQSDDEDEQPMRPVKTEPEEVVKPKLEVVGWGDEKCEYEMDFDD